jgi:hypothetical protein
MSGWRRRATTIVVKICKPFLSLARSLFAYKRQKNDAIRQLFYAFDKYI